MIPDRAPKSDRPSALKALAKKTIGLLPASMPGRIYNASAKIPFARTILKAYVSSLVPESIEIEEGTLYLDRSDMAVSGALAMGSFEPFETEIFRKAARPGMTVVDIGAQIGYYAVIFGRRTGPNGKVFAFEPEGENRALLEKNIRENHLSNVSIVDKAVSDGAGKRELFIEKDNKGHHSFASGGGDATTVETVALDGYLKAFGSPKIDIVKIDIEGAEPIALRGMRETIARSPRMVIFTEVYPRMMERLGESPVAYLNELRSLGFSLSVIDADKKQLVPIADIDVFVKSIPKGESFRNILAKKG